MIEGASLHAFVKKRLLHFKIGLRFKNNNKIVKRNNLIYQCVDEHTFAARVHRSKKCVYRNCTSPPVFLFIERLLIDQI